jgi:hypothetical protein
MIVADIEVPDCFVSGPLKNKKETGNVGHGESRLYVGNDEAVCKTLTTKPWVFDFDNYEESITDHEMFDFMMDNISRFTKEYSLTLTVEEQNGKQDCRRFYVGGKPNKAAWTVLRKCLVPQKTRLQVFDSGDTFAVRVIYTGGQKLSNCKGYSMIAIRWLEYLEKKENIKIRHALQGGEFSIRTQKGYTWPVDGFCEETNTVYEFMGDYFHGNPAKYAATDTFHGRPYSLKWEKDARKKDEFTSRGFNYVTMWESDWNSIEKELKCSKT